MDEQSAFVVELLTTLRQERFSPVGWWRFLGRSWALSCETARAQPRLRRSWLRLTWLISALALASLLLCAWLEGLPAALRLLPGLTICVAWQQSDLFWHLGLNRSPYTGSLQPTLGLANTFTWLRALAASFLLARLLGGLYTPSELVLLVLGLGICTDILDGAIARTTATQSRLGQIADGETDFMLSLAVTLILLQNGSLPLWLALLLLLRFALPLLAALISYFWLAQPVRFGSTLWGKAAGLAQCLAFLDLLAPTSLNWLALSLRTPLLAITVLMLLIAPVAQLLANWSRQDER